MPVPSPPTPNNKAGQENIMAPTIVDILLSSQRTTTHQPPTHKGPTTRATTQTYPTGFAAPNPMDRTGPAPLAYQHRDPVRTPDRGRFGLSDRGGPPALPRSSTTVALVGDRRTNE
jgi:hypothetical protein